MAFDNPTRNRLQRLVSECRELLTREFNAKLQELYGIYAEEGRVLDLAKLPHLDDEKLRVATLLRERIEHLASSGGGTAAAIGEAVKRVLREQAFTVLNRFAALRMAEERGIIVEAVGGGLNSKGFKTFSEVAYSGLGTAYERYRVFLSCMCDEMAVDLGVLFDRQSPYGLLFPRENVLLELFERFNTPEIKPLWKEDETIGWIYQYYNDEAERKKMREESSAPRNSRELAVRNQFFTPRYVVEFLTDNTLGRLWYEMSGSGGRATSLAEKCRYLVRRPNEIFLKAGESALTNNEPTSPRPSPPVAGGEGEAASGAGAAAGDSRAPSQEELLKQPVFIPHRSFKDPREIRLLDPACGSMHFGLYAFDLFEVIYEEYWDLTADGKGHLTPALSPQGGEGVTSSGLRPPSPQSGEGLKPLRETYATKEEFLRDVPRLIVEHNIHGIDIDPRAAQIAGLSLWLRAQRAWHQAGVKPADRPRITRSNLVCAEPMPGEKELLREFVEQQFPAGERPAFAFLLETVFDRMTLAGEAGSLLRIEEEIRAAIAEAKRLWKAGPKHEQATLFPEAGARPDQGEMRLDLSGITDEQFWERAEQRIYDALEAYAERAENGGGFQRRLFADDAAQGFAFIDLCRKRYDVVVMNPPFGEITPSFKDYATKHYRRSKSDILCMFVERVTQFLAPSCFCAAITNRTPFFTDGTEAWREAFCLGGEATSVRLFADLGHKVLDTALVETAAYSLTRGTNQRELSWFNVTQVTEKESALLQQIRAGGSVAKLTDIEAIPGKRLSYWLPSSVVRCYSELPSLAGSVESVDKGMSTTDDFRFIRAFWEVPNAPSPDGWMYYSKGGEYSPFASDVHLAVKWHNGGREISEVIIAKYPYLNGDAGWVLHPETHHGYTGLTYTKRTTSSFSARLLPTGARVSDLANLVYDSTVEKLLGALVCLSTSPFHYLLDAAVPSIDSSAGGTAARHYEVGTLREVPVPAANLEQHAESGAKLFRFAQARYCADEATNYFNGLPALSSGSTLRNASADEERAQLQVQLDAIELHAKSERSFIADYGLDEGALEAVYDYMGPHPASLPHSELSQLVLPNEVWKRSEEQLTALLVQTYGGKRRFSKQTWVGGREIELWAYVTNLAPAELARSLQANPDFSERNASDFATRVVSFLVGAVFGRWDIRYATGERPAPELPDPFAPLPVCPPGMLQGDDGLPLSLEAGRRVRTEGRYPLDVAWDGILVDDPEHPLDLERRVHAALEVIWGAKGESTPHPSPLPGRGGEGGGSADALEHEACALLGVPTLRDYFRRGFFADHLKRYSKSRRQAPIYWPLSTASGSYTLWIYYHRLTDQTLFQCVNDFVKPKLAEVEADLARVQKAENREQRAELERLTTLRGELMELRDELLRVAQLPYKPNLNDGVLITASPLWKLFRLPKWQKDLKACWAALEKGEYDWAHLAYTIWPARVREVCKKDRSIAIAHGLEDLCEVKAPEKKAKKAGKGKKKTDSELALEQD